jgi:Protein of unknown function (DUF2786)
MKSSNEIIEKIQKLLALANSDNENEAKLAAERATALLTKHNLSLQDVSVEDRQYTHAHFMGKTSRRTMEQSWIFSIVQKFFFVKVVSGKRYNPNIGKTVTVWSFFGQPHNVEVAIYVYQFLDNTFVNLYEEYAKNGGKTGKKARNSFYAGLHTGLCQQLSATQAKVQQEAGLVIVPDAGLDNFINETVGKTKKSVSKSVNIDAQAFSKGAEEGKNIRIAKGLGSQSNQSGTVLSIAGNI